MNAPDQIPGFERELWSLDAEQAVLGSLMLDNGGYDTIGDRLGPQDFFYGVNRRVFDAIVAILTAGKEANVITVAEHLAELGRLEECGGLAHIGSLVSGVASTTAIAQYAGIVRDRRLERDLYAAGGMLVDIAYDKATPVAERMDQAQALVLKLSEAGTVRDLVPIGELLHGAIADLEARSVVDGGAIVGLSTGLIDLDNKLRGLMPGQVVIVAGRPGMGKSVLAETAAITTARSGKPVAVFTLEMAAKEWTDRAIVSIGHIDHDRYRSGNLTREEYTAVSTAVGILTNAPLYLDDSETSTIEQIRTKARRIKRQNGLALIVIDYLQLLEGRGESRREQVDHISRQTKRLARELAVPIIAVAQLNRQLETRTNKRPILADLRESGGLEQDADTVVFLYRDEEYNPNTMDVGIVELDVAKQRAGPTGRVRAAWIGEQLSIRDLARDYSPPPPPPLKPRRRRNLDEDPR